MRTGSFRLHGILSALLATTMAGAAPPILDRVPPGPALTIAVMSLRQLDEASARLLASLEIKGVAATTRTLERMGLARGVDLDGSAAALLYPAEEDGSDPPLLLLIPVTSAEEFLKTGKPIEGSPLTGIELAGVVYYARPVGDGVVALGAGRDLVEGFNAESGRLDQHRSSMGPRGREIAGHADIMALGRSELARPLLERSLAPLLAGFPAMGAPGENFARDPRLGIAGRIMTLASDEARHVTIGLSATSKGVRADLAVVFSDDSLMAQVCRESTEDADPFRSLPRQNYFFLGAVNTAHPGLRLMLEELSPPDRALGAIPEAERLIVDATKGMRTAVVAVYEPPNLIMAALTRTMIAWESETPRDAAVAFQAWLRRIARVDEDDKPTVTSYAPAARTIAGASIDEWTIEPPPGAYPMLPLLFGPGKGPQGFLAVKGDLGFLTWSRDEALLGAVVKAAQGTDEASLSSDPALAQASLDLPRPRVVEWYLNPSPIFKQIQMFGRSKNKPKPSEASDPVACSLVMDGGSLQATIIIPPPLLRLATTRGVFGEPPSLGEPNTPQ